LSIQGGALDGPRAGHLPESFIPLFHTPFLAPKDLLPGTDQTYHDRPSGHAFTEPEEHLRFGHLLSVLLGNPTLLLTQWPKSFST
jgi:hypothetical protein